MNSIAELRKKSKLDLINIIRDLQVLFKEKNNKPKDWFITNKFWNSSVPVVSIPKKFANNVGISKNGDKYYKIYLEEVK